MDASLLNALNEMFMWIAISGGGQPPPPRDTMITPPAEVQRDHCGHEVVSAWNKLEDPTCPPLPAPPEETASAEIDRVINDLDVSKWRKR
jgi:hypothetical protein